MENTLIIKRTQLSFDEEQFQFLNERSDHPIEDGYIFSRLIKDHSELASLLAELQKGLGISDQFSQDVLSEWPEDRFAQHRLVLMFSDERSGSNTLTLEKAETVDDRICLSISRQRGLTMDMAYLFLFYETEDCSAERSEVQITNLQSFF